MWPHWFRRRRERQNMRFAAIVLDWLSEDEWKTIGELVLDEPSGTIHQAYKRAGLMQTILFDLKERMLIESQWRDEKVKGGLRNYTTRIREYRKIAGNRRRRIHLIGDPVGTGTMIGPARLEDGLVQVAWDIDPPDCPPALHKPSEIELMHSEET